MVIHQRCILSTHFLVGLALASGVFLVEAQAQVLDSALVPKWQTPLTRVCGLVKTANCASFTAVSTANNIDYYEISSRQIQQQILPAPYPMTTVWAFGPTGGPDTAFNTPAPTIVASRGTEVRVKWTNGLVSGNTFITYPAGVPVATDIHWANPPQQCAQGTIATDCKGAPGIYQGPVPQIVHVHGAISASESDGIPEAWNLPTSSNPGIASLLASGYKASGSDYCQIDTNGNRSCAYNNDGTSLFSYPNSQPPGTLFFHDHTLGITLQNVYLGLVGFYLIGGGPTDVTTLPSGDFEIPLAIQAKSFTADGSSIVLSNAEGIGNIRLVNGVAWPFVNVQARKYRLRFVNANAGEDIKLQLPGALTFQQIGNDAGFLPAPVMLHSLRLSTGERADVIVDFASYANCSGSGCNVVMIDDAADNADVRQVLQFQVQPGHVNDPTVVPNTFTSDVPDIVTNAFTPVRSVSLFDNKLGTCGGANCSPAAPHNWDDAVTEIVPSGGVEIWDIYDFKDSHPIHLHEVQFQVVGRRPIGSTGSFTPAAPGERGFKDTVVANSGQVTRINVRFGGNTGLFAWHCHIAEHEDAEMMRPMCVVPAGQYATQNADAERFCAPK